MKIEQYIHQKTDLNEKNILAVITLLNEGATIPFIARYRKDLTGNLEDFEIFNIQKEAAYYNDLIKRKETILNTLQTIPENTLPVQEKVTLCWNKKDLEDLYAPYKTQKNSKATIAKSKGLEGLAKIIMSQNNATINLQPFIKNGIQNSDEALDGALAIISEWIGENIYTKNLLRKQLLREGVLTTQFKKGQFSDLYKDYEKFTQKATKIPSHRVLAILRGVQEGFLTCHIDIDKTSALEILEKYFLKANHQASLWVQKAIQQTYAKNLRPALEKELLKEIKQKADVEAIRVFSKNLEQLLLTAPLGYKTTLAIDPGFKSGCKIVVLNAQGDLLTDTVIYPHPPINQLQESTNTILNLITQYQVEHISIGNGTAGRETEFFLKKILLPKNIQISLVSECGASVYSASEIGREEFPNKDVTVRGAVSIGRRTMDPLAELVKIEPKSLGIGQYQHDVDQLLLKTELDYVVTKAVNAVGVQLNTASKHLLQYIAGIGPTIAQNIIDYRTLHGKFSNLNELKNVPRLGNKAFEQAAGFLRIDGTEILDNTAIHPEQYKNVSLIAKKLQLPTSQLIGNSLLDNILSDEKFIEKIGKNTLEDIIKELKKPNTDPRIPVKQLEFNQQITSFDKLQEGMVLQGRVNNLTNFGAFVDLGIKENGLLHISQITEKFISAPSEILRLNEIVTVKIIQLDVPQKRIALTMKNL